MHKSGLKQAGEIMTLIGGIFETIIHVILIFVTIGLWIIPAAALIPLAWVTRKQSVTNEVKGWMIYGIVQSFFFNLLGFIGYILLLIDKNNLENQSENKKE